MPESGENGAGPDLGGGIRRRTQEVSQQVLQIEGGTKLLVMFEKLGSMEAVVEKLTKAIKDLDPKSPRGQRSLPALCRPLADIFFKCQKVNMQLLREQQVEEVPIDVMGLTDEQVLAMAQQITTFKESNEMVAEGGE